jgi:hypothetical protein
MKVRAWRDVTQARLRATHPRRPAQCEFVGLAKSPTPMQLPGEIANHDELMSNFFAQPAPTPRALVSSCT